MAQAAKHTHQHEALVTRSGNKHTNPIHICATPQMPTPHITRINPEALSLCLPLIFLQVHCTASVTTA